MSDFTKVRPSHTRRSAFVYIRQSSPSQVENNRESTARQYALVEKACELGWAKEQVIVIDEDLGRSEEHTSELQSLRHLVCRLLLEKKKTKNHDNTIPIVTLATTAHHDT